VFEDLNCGELRRRANPRLPDRVLANPRVSRRAFAARRLLLMQRQQGTLTRDSCPVVLQGVAVRGNQAGAFRNGRTCALAPRPSGGARRFR
jgi:hypothetical protein